MKKRKRSNRRTKKRSPRLSGKPADAKADVPAKLVPASSHSQVKLAGDPAKGKRCIPPAASGAQSAGQNGENALAIGLDIGTVNIVAVCRQENKDVMRKGRNAFLLLRNDEPTKSLLKKLKMECQEIQGQLYVCGDAAYEMANYFESQIQRPMSIGVLNCLERSSIPMLDKIVKGVVWQPRKKNEICGFSVPAEPMDGSFDITYHRNVLETMLRVYGFKPVATNEGYAVILSELGHTGYTGIGISCGGGMVNVCVAYKSIIISSFAIGKGGDWIDASAAHVLGVIPNKVTYIKEQGMNLNHPKTREQEAIAVYYKQFIRDFLSKIAEKFSRGEDAPQFDKPVEIVFAGGTTMVGGFLENVRMELEKVPLGIPIADIRVSTDLACIAKGCLANAIYAVDAIESKEQIEVPPPSASKRTPGKAPVKVKKIIR